MPRDVLSMNAVVRVAFYGYNEARDTQGTTGCTRSALRTAIGVGVGRRFTSQHASSTAAVGAHGDAHGNGSDKSTLPPLMMIPTGPLIPKPWNAGLLAAANAVALLGSTTSFSLSQSKRIASMISYMQHRVAHQRDRCNVMPPRHS